MGHETKYWYEPCLKDCSCHKTHNLPMFLGNDNGYWVECDFCGNATRICKTDKGAEFRWNEFDAGKGLLKKKATIENSEVGVGIFRP